MSKIIGGRNMENVIQKLNIYLADLNVFYRKLQNFHWNIQGEDFFVWHEKLEEYYNAINTQIDAIAEHILMLNGQPMGRMNEYLKQTHIQEAQDKKIDQQEVVRQIVQDYTTLLDSVKSIKKVAEEQEMYSTSSMTDTYMAEYEKIIWMLSQSAK
jgi:starvation-inducible DNA-binding protein